MKGHEADVPVDILDVLPPVDELVIGIVKAVGTTFTTQLAELERLLNKAGYHVEKIDVSKYWKDAPGRVEPSNRFRSLWTSMEEGDNARARRTDALALYAIRRVVELRASNRHQKLAERYAYVVDQMVHPEEVATLRTVYGSHFILISLYQDEDERRNNLIDELQSSVDEEKRTEDPPDSAETLADRLMNRDRGDGSRDYRISIERTFHRADVFIDVADPPHNRNVTRRRVAKPQAPVIDGFSTNTLGRLFEQIFSGSRYGLTKHEVAMGYAYSASLRSGSLARRVGAAIVTPDGTLLSAGYNEVPAPGGGQYPVRQFPVQKGNLEDLDFRDDNFTPHVADYEVDEAYGYDSNDLIKYEIFEDLIHRLKAGGYLLEEFDPWDMIALRPAGDQEPTDQENAERLRDAELFDVIEFSRSVHAEMSALMSALRHRIPIRGCHLYTTTFPCHACARHIVAAGIDRVVYVEPYPKSRVDELHRDSIILGRRSSDQEKVLRRPVEFIPFIGIAPARQAELFSATKRKYSFGEINPPGRSIEAKESSVVSPDAALRWVSAHKLLRKIVPAQRQIAERAVLETEE